MVKAFSRLALVFLCSLGLIACDSLAYYGQAAKGQMSLLMARQDIQTLLMDDSLPEPVRDKLSLVLEARTFARDTLLLEPGGSYLSYVELDRPYVVWNVFAAPEFSISPMSWCYPVAGCVSYRGYFSEQGAQAFADSLQAQNLDVYSGGVDAYSTLGWFDDPLNSAVLRRPEPRLLTLVFHELAHRRVYLPGDTTFNESFATFVEQEGLRRWLLQHKQPQMQEQLAQEARVEEAFVALVSAYRERLADLYARALAADEMREGKQEIQRAMREDYARFRDAWNYRGYDRWFDGPLNNAQLSTVASYNDLVPAFTRLLAEENGDLARFYRRVEQISRLPEDQRNALLAEPGFELGDQVAVEL
ncbi:MAG: aminopeptidase [Pseudomonadales bacterium]|nr:aminopeptidase [Pseudomonadales bacterium]MCP5330582.1 aminopeptidase [Pseudomonadales bacterium]MCP5344209.1 aminopeptidase [Pseudomonadales bacterium]